ncbi:MAG: hypothetical protein ACP5PJ_05965, partial [Acidimicrobiales bacterium]
EVAGKVASHCAEPAARVLVKVVPSLESATVKTSPTGEPLAATAVAVVFAPAVLTDFFDSLPVCGMGLRVAYC